MKKLLALVLALIIVTASFTGCFGAKDDQTSDDTVLDTAVESESADDSVQNDGASFTTDIELIESKPTAETNDVALEDIHTAIKELFGENYLPSMPLDTEYLEMTYGVKPEWIESYVAEIPMISFHVDTLIAIKAADGQADNVESALNDYRTYVVENSLQYPANVPKVNASRVYRAGDYVFFLMLGVVGDEYMDDENGAYNVAVENNEKVVSKIEELLIK